MKTNSIAQVLLLLAVSSVVAGCAINPFSRSDHRWSQQDQTQDKTLSDMQSGPVCASSADCGASQNIPNHPPSALTYSSKLHKQLETVGKELDLTPKQTVLWDNYMTKLNALILDQSDPDKNIPNLGNAPRQIQRKLDISRNRFTAIEDVSEAAIKLYQSLDDHQKKLADQMLPTVIPALYASLGDSIQTTKFPSTQDSSLDGSRTNGGYGKRRGGNNSGGQF